MNCLIVDDEQVSRMIVRDFVERTPSLKLVGECSNAVEAFKELKQQKVDILFLDIEMPEMTGIELVQSLEEMPQVILITGRKDFGPEAYEAQVTDYLVKPINYPRFEKAIEKASKNLKEAKAGMEIGEGQDHIYVKADNKVVRVELGDIRYIEALSDYVIINLAKKRLIVHATMKGLERKLPSHLFARVHRSYIININKIESIEDMCVVMGDKNIPIGNSYKSGFMGKLNFL